MTIYIDANCDRIDGDLTPHAVFRFARDDSTAMTAHEEAVQSIGQA